MLKLALLFVCGEGISMHAYAMAAAGAGRTLRASPPDADSLSVPYRRGYRDPRQLSRGPDLPPLEATLPGTTEQVTLRGLKLPFPSTPSLNLWPRALKGDVG